MQKGNLTVGIKFHFIDVIILLTAILMRINLISMPHFCSFLVVVGDFIDKHGPTLLLGMMTTVAVLGLIYLIYSPRKVNKCSFHPNEQNINLKASIT